MSQGTHKSMNSLAQASHRGGASPETTAYPAPTIRPWFREPMVWLVITIPFATVIAGFATLATALHAGHADAVIDPVKRTGRMQEFKMAGDREAARLGLTAHGRIDVDTGALNVHLAGKLPSTSQLIFTFAHPVRTSEDRQMMVIAHDASSFLGHADIALDHDWNLILAPADGSWRLVGRFYAHAEAFELRPALPAG